MENKKDLSFNFDVTALSNYVNEVSTDLLSQSILSDNTSNYVTVMPGVKSAENINLLDSTISVQAGSAGFNAAGSTDFDFVTLAVDKMKINEELDPYQLEQKWIQVAMTPGSIQEGVPFEAYIAEEKATKISKIVAEQVWKGNKSTGSGNLALADGFVASLVNQGGFVSGPTAGTAYNASNIVASLDTMIASLDEDVLDKEDLTMFVSPAMYRTLVNALKALNNYWIDPAITVNNEFMYPFSNVKVVRTAGLANSGSLAEAKNGNDVIVLGPSKLMFWGTDLVSDYSSFKLFYAEAFDSTRFICRYKLGTAIAYPQYFVVNI